MYQTFLSTRVVLLLLLLLVVRFLPERVRGAGTGLEPAWDMVVRGSLQWLPARVMCDLPRWHTQRCGRCQNSRYLYGQRRALPLSSSTCSART